MALGTIAAKTYSTALEERNLVLEPCVAYQRLTALPSDWKACRIAAVLSVTNTSEQNGIPISELLSTAVSPLNSPYFGITDGGGMPSRGGKFVGMSNSSIGSGNYNHGVSVSGASAKLIGHVGGSNWFPAPCRSEGAALIRGQTANDCSGYTIHTPAEVNNYCFSIGLTINTGTDGSLSLGYFGAANQSNVSVALNGALAGSPYYTFTVTGGWWNNSTIFTGCKHLFIRWPFLSNRLRIHALRIMHLA